MDPPPLQPQPTTIPTPIHTATTTTTNHLNYPDSANSSPRSHHTDTWDEPLPPVPGAKLRLMCSYGGHIMPRPHDKSLCYVGGDTRIVVVDRQASLSEFHSRLSHTLLNGRQFSLKYQLPNEDLDSLVTITTDEDLENMIEEYDRINSTSPLRPSRLRLFLFPVKPETAASMGCLLDDAKSETWFVDVLNGASLLPRGLSDSATIDNLVELDEPQVNRDSGADIEAQNVSSGGDSKQAIINVSQDVQSTLSDSPIVETTSSFDSSVSSPSMSNLPPIKVRIDEANARLGGLDEQFSQMNVASNAQRQDDRSHYLTNVPPPFPTIVGGAGMYTAAATGENLNRIISDDEKSDRGAPSGTRKPPLPLQPVPRKFGDAYSLPSPDSKHAGGYNLHSPDSVASDSSIASAASLSKHAIYQDAAPTATRETRIPAAVVDPQSNTADPSTQIQMQQVPDTMVLPSLQPNQLQQQQFLQTSAHYIQHPATGQMPMSSYYPVYAPPPQQAIQQTDQQYPMYLLPVTQAQPYNLTVQSNIADPTSVSVSRPLTPPNPNFVPATAYKEIAPPIYPAKTTTPKPEVPANLYITPGTATPTLVQVPANQFQQQYYGLSQMPPPSQSIAAGSASATNYGYEYTQPALDHAYYAQHPTATLPQYQTMAPAAAVMLSQASTQLATDNTSQKISSSQL